MKILNIIILILGVGGGITGSSFIQKIKLQKIEKAHQKEINFKMETIATLRQNINFIVKSGSVKQSQIEQIQSTMLVIQKRYWQIRIDSIKQAKSIVALENWKADAQDGVVTDTVNIEYKTNIFGKRKRIK